MLKKLLIIIFSVLFSESAFADADTWVVLKIKGGVTQSYLVAGKMKVRAEKDSLRLTSPNMEVAYPRSMVEGYYFQKDNAIQTEIEGITQKGISVKYLSKDRVEISGITTNTAVKLYGINGIEYKAVKTEGRDTIVIVLSSLPHGTYIIKIDGVGVMKVYG